jgi:hypothetical protein
MRELSIQFLLMCLAISGWLLSTSGERLYGPMLKLLFFCRGTLESASPSATLRPAPLHLGRLLLPPQRLVSHALSNLVCPAKMPTDLGANQAQRRQQDSFHHFQVALGTSLGASGSIQIGESEKCGFAASKGLASSAPFVSTALPAQSGAHALA